MSEDNQEVLLYRKEQQLTDKEADLFREETKMEHLEEDYFHHLTQANHLFNELNDTFSQTEKGSLFADLSHEVHQGSQKMTESLNEVRETLLKERRQVQQELDDVTEERRQLVLQEEEETS